MLRAEANNVLENLRLVSSQNILFPVSLISGLLTLMMTSVQVDERSVI